ncbi:hypothetical protein H4582DRAFT_1923801 [Lactarius indigo]|nr:hypothetical protein H4582DRAFT_1923801 [Lactarius indigo]
MGLKSRTAWAHLSHMSNVSVFSLCLMFLSFLPIVIDCFVPTPSISFTKSLTVFIASSSFFLRPCLLCSYLLTPVSLFVLLS